MRRYIRSNELLAVDPSIVEQEGPRAFFWLFGPPVFHNERVGSNDQIAVVRINGPLDHHSDCWSDNYDDILCRVSDAMTGQDVVDAHAAEHRYERGYKPLQAKPPTHVVLCLDSPGGVVAGLHQAVAKIRRMSANSGVPVVAYVDEMAYSACFALACSSQRIVLPPSGFLGSIGVISTMVDQTAWDKKHGLKFVVLTSGARKADGHPHVPITDDMIAVERPRVMRLAKFFWQDVRDGRAQAGVDLSIATIRGFEAGRFLGKEARKAGLADDVMGFDELVESLEQESKESKGSKSNGGKTKPPERTDADEESAEAIMGKNSIDALIRRTEKAVASESDPKKLTKLRAELASYERTKAAITAKGDETKRTEDDDDSDDDDSDDDDDSESEDEEEDEEESSSSADDEPYDDEDEEDSEGDEEDEEEEDDEEEDEEEARVRDSALASARSVLRGAKRSGDRKAIQIAKAHLASVKSLAKAHAAVSGRYGKLRAHASKVTGKRGTSAIMGALDALKATAKNTEKLAGDVGKIRAHQRRERVDAMLDKARREGRVSKAQIPALRTQGIANPKWLKGYLGVLPKVRTLDEGALEGASKGGEVGSASAKALSELSGEQRKAIETMATDAGKSAEDFFAEMQKRSAHAASQNGVTR